MYISNKRVSESILRKRLEYCFDQGLLQESILVGNKLDKMQSILFQREQEMNTNKKPIINFSVELIHA